MLPTRLSSVQRSRTLIAVALVLTIPGLSALRGDWMLQMDRVGLSHFTPERATQKNVFEEAGIPRRAEAPTTARIAAGCVTRHIVTRKLPIERAIERIIDPKMDRGTSRVVREGSDGEMIQAVLVKRGATTGGDKRDGLERAGLGQTSTQGYRYRFARTTQGVVDFPRQLYLQNGHDHDRHGI